VPRLFQIHSNITFPSKWSQSFWNFDENCVGIFHFSQFWDYLLKITLMTQILLIYHAFMKLIYHAFMKLLFCVFWIPRIVTRAPSPPHTYIYIFFRIYVWNLDPCPFISLFAEHATFQSKNWAYVTTSNIEDSMINVSCSRSKYSIQFQIQERKDCCKTRMCAQADGDTNT
jgi:hypothetical protein